MDIEGEEAGQKLLKKAPRSQKKREKREILREKRKNERSAKRRKKRLVQQTARRQFLSSFTEEERKAFVVKEKMEKEKQKVEIQKREDEYFQEGLRVCVNCSFNDLMSPKEISSLAKQLSYSYLAVKNSPSAIQLHVSSLDDSSPLLVSLMQQGYSRWKIHVHKGKFTDVFPKEEVVVLSPDAEEEIEAFSSDKVYVIGGLVDRSVAKNASWQQAQEEDLCTQRLPIRKYVPNFKNGILNVNTVVSIISSWLQSRDWSTALTEAIPTRKLHQGELDGKKARRKRGQPLDVKRVKNDASESSAYMEDDVGSDHLDI